MESEEYYRSKQKRDSEWIVVVCVLSMMGLLVIAVATEFIVFLIE